jgi:hypothetical protein
VSVPAIGTTPSVPGTPYIVPTAVGWTSTALLTSGNEVKGYRMAGIPDGLGAFENGDRSITVLMTHEIAPGKGAVRAHGGTGAYVSRWVINKDTLEVVDGRDFLAAPEKLHLWSNGSWKAGDTSAGKLLDINRLCSADLAPVSAFYNAASRNGYNGRLFLTGEEGGNTNANRAFAFVTADGTAYELPAFSFGTPKDQADPPPSWENLLAHPATGDTTLVMALSDGGTKPSRARGHQLRKPASRTAASSACSCRAFGPRIGTRTSVLRNRLSEKAKASVFLLRLRTRAHRFCDRRTGLGIRATRTSSTSSPRTATTSQATVPCTTTKTPRRSAAVDCGP